MGLSLLLLPAAGFAAVVTYTLVEAHVDTVGDVEFNRPLAIPPLARSHVGADGVRVFDIKLQQGRSDFGRGEPTPTWGVNGDYLGPTLRANRGESVRVNVANNLGEKSTLHWHGMHVPAAMDGGPHQLISDGETWSPHWTIDQQAATLWYHPHPHGETAEHVYRGVAGLFLIDDTNPSSRELPHTYGVDDIPVIVQDKNFDGADLDESDQFLSNQGILGDHILVNGTPGPYFNASSELVRLRLLNASNARVYNFHFDDERQYDLIATDGGLLPAPVRLTHLELSPGERAEIVIRLSPRETTVLRSAPLTSAGSRLDGADDRFDVLELRAGPRLHGSTNVPSTLATMSPPRADDVGATRSFRLGGTNINGKDMDMDRIDAAVEGGSTERWVVDNPHGNMHNFHIHDRHFVVESIDGRPPPPELAGWKDTVFLPEGRKVELLLRFGKHTDRDTPYMFHCHILRHEDRGMMGQFVVVEPGEQEHAVSHDGHAGH